MSRGDKYEEKSRGERDQQHECERLFYVAQETIRMETK